MSTNADEKTLKDRFNVGDTSDLPVFDLAKYINRKDGDDSWKEECKKIAEVLHKYGMLLIKDPRVTFKDNDVFIDMMEKYFEQPREVTAKDAHPEYMYQVGVTPDFKEQARDHCERASKYEDSSKPVTVCPPGADAKWRFFWRMGDLPEVTKFPIAKLQPVIPAAFPQWPEVMNNWGSKMLAAVRLVAEMAAIGFDLPPTTFTEMMNHAPHLLAPTGSNLAEHNKLATAFASFHYDLNFMTIHGRSRFPGLYAWTRDNRKLRVVVPENCLLVQAGKQFEWLTGGYVLAGFHEVVVSPQTQEAIEKARKENRSLWRVSSTLFSHIASDNILRPLDKFATPEAIAKYPPTPAGQQVRDELVAIKLGQNSIAAF